MNSYVAAGLIGSLIGFVFGMFATEIRYHQQRIREINGELAAFKKLNKIFDTPKEQR